MNSFNKENREKQTKTEKNKKVISCFTCFSLFYLFFPVLLTNTFYHEEWHQRSEYFRLLQIKALVLNGLSHSFGHHATDASPRADALTYVGAAHVDERCIYKLNIGR